MSSRLVKILISGAGGAPAENVIRSLQGESARSEEIIGMGSEPADLMLSSAVRKYRVPYATSPRYRSALQTVLTEERPDLLHLQNDQEIREVSRFRDEILAQGTRLYLPAHETIENCIDKYRSYRIWQAHGIRVPATVLLTNQDDLRKAFARLGRADGTIWLRATSGAGGRGALPTNDYEFARRWIDRFNGWGSFTAAELLKDNSITWLSIWYRGELVVAQTRKRWAWIFGNRTLSGVTGITRVGETCSDPTATQVALAAIEAIDTEPHGIYGVDLTYDFADHPNPTEINIARFFTTVHFFTQAGLNLPKIFKDIALYGEFPNLPAKINPLPDGLLWIRGMDREPRLTTREAMQASIREVSSTEGQHEP